MKRRNFLKNTGLASTALFVPQFLNAFNPSLSSGSRSGKKLIVIQLSGGNDGLNTIIPYRNDIYYKSRPTIGISKQEVLKISDELGLNPAMKGLQSLYEEGLVSIINSVGYPNPDRSHFRSMDIWHTASDSNEYLSSGWIGRYLDNQCIGCDNPLQAIELDDNLSLAMKGASQIGFAASDPRKLKRQTNNRFLKKIAENGAQQEEDNVAYLYKTLIDTQSSADYLFEKSKIHQSKQTYPKNAFGKDLKQIAELIIADSNTQIYYAGLGGFDTHAGQKGTQARLLKVYSDGVAALVKDLKSNGLLNDVLILTFSEFGRRVKQNGSNGTDHGTANNVFLMGGNLRKPGFYNPAPNLLNLDKGDLKFEIDFREIYATILDKWLGADAGLVLGKGFRGLNLV